jgi:two-component system sensor histidine kinase PhoQ
MEVMGNLMDNAFKYGGSRVRVALATAADSQGVSILVEDDGPGIPATLREEILRRGTRADTLNPGQGIGLAVAKEIIDSYAGRLDIGESNLGGASFRVQLPG